MKQAKIAVLIFAFFLSLSCEEFENWSDKPMSFPPTAESTLQGDAKLSPSMFRSEFSEYLRNLGRSSESWVRLQEFANEADPVLDTVQPPRGISALYERDDGTLLFMSKHGTGSTEHSPDDVLRVYEFKIDFHSPLGEAGTGLVTRTIELSDPDGYVQWTIANSLNNDRILTRADFDIESMQEAADKTLWFGDEFGPFLLHTDANGVLLQAPIPLPDYSKYDKELRSPQNPNYEETASLRVMNALRQHGRIFGIVKKTVISPHHTLIRDGNDRVNHYARDLSTPVGLEIADSEIFDISLLQRAGYAVVPWTINDTPRMSELISLGVDGIISDRPDLLYAAIAGVDVDGDGQADLLHEDGTIDLDKFDAQGHRGARDLRPENTLPAIEVALDHLMTTVEIDIGLSSDAVPMVTHDAHVWAQKCRTSDGTNYEKKDEVLIKSLSSAEIQQRFVCDKLFRGPLQKNDLSLSPVSVKFADFGDLAHAYAIPTLGQLFLFVQSYVEYYRKGQGRTHQLAEVRWKNASRLRFNIEAKRDPRKGKEHLAFGPKEFAEAIGRQIVEHGLSERSNVQSFDFQVPIAVHSQYPLVRTAYLFSDFPIIGSSGRGGGTNIQGQDGGKSPWLAGLAWPYRSTQGQYPARVASNGGFEGLAMSSDKRRLFPILQKPLVDSGTRELLIHEYDLTQNRYSGKQWRVLLDDKTSEVSGFQLFGSRHGIVIEGDEKRNAAVPGMKQFVQVYLSRGGELN